MVVANLIGGVVILFLGLIIRFFKASGLIAGYNTASKEEKAKYDEEKLTKFVGNMLICASAVLLIGGILSSLESATNYIVTISWALFFLVIIYMMVYTNSGKVFKK